MKVLRQAQQAQLLDCSRWTVRRIAETDPTYPPQREFSPGIVGVLEDEFLQWQRTRPIVRPKPRGTK